MTKKHFAALASAVNQITDEGERMFAAEVIGRVCADSNKNFNWVLWKKACGVC